ncbi:transmembrane protein 229b-like isoform X1 [Phyllopteryx taeniolatus]|uniref:transmembrane protein 229b-like isoform X1 n=1 Tax=Phyllopteryx taeniolatus TaxID=161469 RepID=UPI002AD3BCE4|nr:transmembrane protein 229b-like isoform X1 [Phyllopteryx taeniolatus]
MESRISHERRTHGGGPLAGHVGDKDPAELCGRVSTCSLSVLARLYVYALHGCFCEVTFTAVLDWCSIQDRRMMGYSSLWALPMYASAIYLMESLRGWLLAHHQPLSVRLITYTLFIYLWEFSWGSGLRLLGACPWDYSGYKYNLGGLVTLEYALPWAIAAFIAEQHVIKNTLRIRMFT